MKRPSKTQIWQISGMALLSALFILLRVKHLGHLLMWDEAWNILSLRAYLSGAVENPFYWYYSFHPPLYMFFASLLSPLAEGFAYRAQSLSLILSLGTFLSVSCIAFRLGGGRYALLTGFFLCVMPLSLGYDTWIKRDPMALLLGYSSILAVLYRRPFTGASLLGFSLLAKESALFFLPAFLFVLMVDGRGADRAKKAALCLLITALISVWWYAGFSTLTRSVGEFYFTEAVYGGTWSRPFYYYAKKLLQDAGLPAMIFIVSGIFSLAYFSHLKRRSELLVPLVITFSVLLPASTIFSTKTPWLSYSAAPALAMTGAAGALFLLGRTHWNRLLRIAVFTPLFLMAAEGIDFDYTSYHRRTYPNGWPGAKVSRDLANYLNARMEPGDKLMLSDFAYWKMPACPVFLYYWEKRPIVMFSGKKDAKEILQQAKDNNVSWLAVASSPDPSYNYDQLIAEISSLLRRKPQQAGWSFIWNVENIRN